VKGKVCIITGANSGIGRAAALELAKKGATVVMVCRSRERGEKALRGIVQASGSRSVHLMVCDLASQRQIHEFVGQFEREFGRLDVLVNNAGLTRPNRTLTEDGIEQVFAVNHLGYFLLANLLLDLLKHSAPARVVNVASEAHRRTALDFGDLELAKGYSVWKVYCQSKLANILFTYELARRLAGTGVTANCVHPGRVRTNIWSNAPGIARPLLALAKLFMRSPEEGAVTLVWLASSPELEGVTGKYFVDLKEARSSPITYDGAAARRRWDVSERMTGPG
jgi:NAD(P)-dependent dehydrogenase (short-subunit alcohol dehydrogenase family)